MYDPEEAAPGTTSSNTILELSNSSGDERVHRPGKVDTTCSSVVHYFVEVIKRVIVF